MPWRYYEQLHWLFRPWFPNGDDYDYLNDKIHELEERVRKLEYKQG